MVAESQRPMLRIRNVFSLALVDQLITSGSNAGLALLAAKSLDLDEFGVFAIVLTVYYLGNGSIRSLYGEPLLVGWSKASQVASSDVQRLTGRVVHISLLMVLPIIPAVIVLFFNASLGAGLVLALPGLFLQTIARWTLYARDEYLRAVIMNLVWAVAMLGLPLVLLAASVDLNAWQFAAIWGISGFVSALWGLAGRLPAAALWNLSPRKLGESWQDGRQYWFLYLLTSGTTQLCLLTLALFAGTDEIGVIRGALLLFSPLGTLFGGLGVRSIQLLARSVWTRSELRSALPKLVAPPVVLVLGWTCVVALAVVVDGNLLGETTDRAIRLLPFVFMIQLGQGALLGPTWILKANGQLERLNRLRAISAVSAVVGTVIAIATDQPWPFLAGLAAGSWIAALGAPRAALESVET